MADETPQQTPATTSGGEGGGEQQAAAKPSGGLASFLPWIVVVGLMPVLAWGVFAFKSKMDLKRAVAPESGHAEEPAKAEPPKKAESEGGHGGGGHGASKEKSKKRSGVERNTKLPIPLTRDAVAYHPRDPDKEGDYDKIVVLDLKGEPRDEAKSDKIIVNIANTGGSRFAVIRISLVGEHESLIERINENRERLLDRASGLLEMKTQDDVEKPGFRSLLKAELLSSFNEILKRGTLQEVIITEFVIQ